ncbi:MAG: alpha-amylase [Clostridia bacterium]|nr:alpha-amylase [Clostridia bacterium]
MLRLRRLFLITLIAACSMVIVTSLAETNAMNWYEIFVRSYQDTDSDGIGDLKGVEQRLDDIAYLGFDGIWLMPVMPSPSYHKYDVTDYCAIDPEYGTLADMQDLVIACHDRNIRIIIDFPINHTSTLHPWFVQAIEALQNDDSSSPYVDYYHFSTTPGAHQVSVVDTAYFYEEQFSGGNMPDLNLYSDAVWEEITAILRFWLTDVGVDGFRLDAVTSYDTGNTQENISLLQRLKLTAETIKPSTFLVGEAWTNLQEIAKYYTSGVDAFFLFPISQAEGWLCRSLRARTPASKYASYLEDLYGTLPDVVLAPFLSNHDTGRAVGSLQARSRPDLVKFAHLVLNLTGGVNFTYYGEEIGMVGSGDDPNKRLAMYWNDEDMTLQPPGVTNLEYAYPCFDDQMKDPDSLLHFIRRINLLKKQYPLLAHGRTSIVYADSHVLVLSKELGDTHLLAALNFSGSEEKAWEMPEHFELVDTLTITGEVQTRDTALLLPPYGLAILR